MEREGSIARWEGRQTIMQTIMQTVVQQGDAKTGEMETGAGNQEVKMGQGGKKNREARRKRKEA